MRDSLFPVWRQTVFQSKQSIDIIMELRNFFNTKTLCIAMAVMSMTIVSCSDNDDKGTVPPPTPPAPEEEYAIEVEEGMTLPEDEFLKVPAVAGDQQIVNALKSIDKVTDVKPFEQTTGYDDKTQKAITKTAYYFNYKQDIDHNNPSKGWFKQQCVLSVAGQDRPTLLHTNGYALADNNRLQNLVPLALESVLDANCLHVEYRYNGWSLPEGYTNRWNYLSAKQQAADLHAIVTAIKQSGVVGKNSKWLASGVSKDGMTTAHYAYFYPNEMDAYVPFCAPFLLDLLDKRPFSYILSKAAYNGNQEVVDKVKAAYRAYVGNKELQAECVKIYKTIKPEYASSADEDIRFFLLNSLFSNYYSKMSYVPYKKWEYMIPKAGDPAINFYDFIMADADTKYKENNLSGLYSSRRAQAVTRHDPYDVQACIDLGSYSFVLDWVEDLLSDAEKKYLLKGYNQATYGVTYDKGKFVSEFLEGMKQSTCHMMFVYGMQDPWTGGQIPDDKMGKNSRKLIIQRPYDESEAGLHNDAISTWSQSERNELFTWLNQLGFATK